MTDELTRDALYTKLKEAFSAKPAMKKKSFLYTVSLFIVTIIMVLLPLAYMAIVAAGIRVLYWHVTSNYTLLLASRSLQGRVLAYFGPVVVGCILIFFLLKPLIAPKVKPPPQKELSKNRTPFLYEVIYLLCDFIGARRPHKIFIDYEVNASAGIQPGLAGFFLNRVNLTLGAPLLEGLTFKQLMGVLAHEFGHFSQTLAMRLVFITQSINHWLHRVVFEKDEWDEKLAQACKDSNWRIGIPLYIARFFIWVSRGILFVLMLIGYLVSHFVLRQMEYDADTYETYLVGHECFEETAFRMTELNAGAGVALENLETLLAKGQLVDNFPKLIHYFSTAMEPDERKELRHSASEEKSHGFSSHPSHRDRITAARETGYKGILDFDASNRLLLDDIDTFNKEISLDFYRESQMDERILNGRLLEFSQFMEDLRVQEESQKAKDELFSPYFHSDNPVFFHSNDTGLSHTLNEITALLESKKEELAALEPEIDKIMERQFQLKVAIRFVEADLPLNEDDLDLDSKDPEVLKNQEKALEEKMREHLSIFDPVNNLQILRLQLVLKQLKHQNPDAAEKFLVYLDLQKNMQAVHGDILTLNAEGELQLQLLQHYRDFSDNEDALDSLKRANNHIHRRLLEIRGKLVEIPFPLEYHVEDASLADFLIPKIPPSDQWGDVVMVCTDMVGNYFSLYHRILRLIAAEMMEES